jgi:hypothetical protein
MKNINEKVEKDRWPKILQHFDLPASRTELPPAGGHSDDRNVISAYRADLDPPSSPLK